MSYYAAKRHQNDVHKLKLRNVVLCCETTSIEAQTCRIMLAFSKLEAARVATEKSYYAAKRPQNDVHNLKLRNVLLCLRLASSELQGLRQTCLIMLQSDLTMMFRNGSSEMSNYACI